MTGLATVGVVTRSDPTERAGSAVARRPLAARVWDALGSRAFLRVVVIVFVAVASVFAVVIRWGSRVMTDAGILAIGSHGVVPDEDRHLGAILFYADRGWWRGPVITDLDERYLRMGELERDPSYLYHWMMSLVVDLLRLVTDDYNVTVIAIRLVTVLIGAAGLVIAYRLLRRLAVPAAIAGLTVAGLSLTGRYVWQSAGASYDIPSTVLFLLFLLVAVRVLQGGGVLDLGLAAMLAALTSITKYTFLPFAGAGVIVLVIVLTVRLRRAGPGALRESLSAAWRDGRLRVLAISVGLLIAAGLFIERIGVNLIVYRAVEPGCASVHDAIACQAYAIFRRNESARAAYLQAVADGATPAHWEPFAYTGEWLQRYYTSLFFYAGRTSTLRIDPVTLALVALVAALVIVLVLTNRRRIFRSGPVVFVAAIAGAYVLGTYAFNVTTYLRYEQYFAHQGRYLLPVLPVVYALVIWLAVGAMRRLHGRARPAVLIPLGAAVGAAVVLHTHVIAFAMHVHSRGWFSPIGNALIDLVRSVI
jgi:hypothetical protein